MLLTIFHSSPSYLFLTISSFSYPAPACLYMYSFPLPHPNQDPELQITLLGVFVLVMQYDLWRYVIQHIVLNYVLPHPQPPNAITASPYMR